MTSISLGFRIHQPLPLQNSNSGGEATGRLLNILAEESYLPANKILLKQIHLHTGKFKVSFSISGTMIEQLKKYRPDVLQSFRELAETGCVDFYAETYYNSLSWLYSKKEFQKQVLKHTELIEETFKIKPSVFRNTELIYNNQLATFIAGLGYKGILCEGIERILKGRNINQQYAAPDNGDFPVLLRNVSLSDDIAFRFDDAQWNENPLTANKYTGWLSNSKNACCINLFFDYETFGIHKLRKTGIFTFLEEIPAEVLKNEDFIFVTAAEAADNCYPKGIYDVPRTISWEDKTEDCCVFTGNAHQHNMLHKIYSLEQTVLSTENNETMEDWRHLQSADYFYYMSERGRKDKDAYKMFNPYGNADCAYKRYRDVLLDFEIGLIKKNIASFNTPYISAGTLY
jgi:alpha-amylase